MTFKFIISFFAVSNLLGGVEAEEWISVPKAPKVEEAAGDIDPSIWVLFSKKFGEENILIRFPEDPVCRTTREGFIARSKSGGEIFELCLQNQQGQSFEGDSLFELDGKWISERIVQSGEHTYRLRAYSLLPEAQNSAQFFSSFRISS